MRGLHRALWVVGWPVRAVLLGLILLYRVTLSGSFGGNCRFHPSCSVYAERAVRNAGALRGSFLAAWRVLRCSPLSHGGVDQPPAPAPGVFMWDMILGHRPGSAIYDGVLPTAREIRP